MSNVYYGLYRPDLAQGVSMVSKFLGNPERQHCDAIKWIFKYLRAITNYGIMFGRQQDDLSFMGYVNANYAGDLNLQEIDYKVCIHSCKGPTCSKSMIQSLVALSTTELEYMAIVEATKETLWLIGLVKELGV